MIQKSLISLIHEAVSIPRWNDHIRPCVGFTELDKQAHKMFYAFVLAKCEGDAVDWCKLIEGGIFEFFHRIILTDIKPPIYHRLMEEKGDELNQWVLTELEPHFIGIGGHFFDRMKQYYSDKNNSHLEKQILNAAHYLATDWEFRIIYSMNRETFGIEEVKKEVLQGLAACNTFSGFRVLADNASLQDFLSLIGKLRYQQRWSKAVRVPATFVMGHMLVVAILSYFMTLELKNPCSERLIQNFFAGLFHDLPEALTRDIVSPVKSSVKGLDHIISEIEETQMKKIIYPLLPADWHKQIFYYTKNEFASKIRKDGKMIVTSSDEINRLYNENQYHPLDGEIIRGCDHLSAYMEAYLSLSCGVCSEQMVNGYHQIKNKHANKIIGGIPFSVLFSYFQI